MLDKLPLDLLLEILSHLNWKDIYSLRQVNRYLYNTLCQDKENRRHVLRRWQNRNRYRTWKYQFYGRKVYRIIRWKNHHFRDVKHVGDLTVPIRFELQTIITSRREESMDNLFKNRYYKGLHNYSRFVCITIPQSEKYGTIQSLGSDILLNLIVTVKEDCSYNLVGNCDVLKEGRLFKGTNIIWFNNFEGIYISRLYLTDLFLKVKPRMNFTLRLTYAFIDIWNRIPAYTKFGALFPIYSDEFVYPPCHIYKKSEFLKSYPTATIAKYIKKSTFSQQLKDFI